MGSRSAERRGSAASDKQIAHAVKAEREVFFQPWHSTTVSGWVIGTDDYHWIVVDTDECVHLVHKSCPLIWVGKTILDDLDVKVSSALRPMTDPYRSHVLRTVFNRQLDPVN